MTESRAPVVTSRGFFAALVGYRKLWLALLRDAQIEDLRINDCYRLSPLWRRGP
jgi:hypothetical protein